MYPLFLLILGVSGVYSDSHTLEYFYTLVTGEGWGLPEFFISGYVDDQQFANYDSDSCLARPVAHWMNKAGPLFFLMQRQIAKDNHAFFKVYVSAMMSHLNWTGGSYCFQAMQGCELTDDGKIAGYYQIGYNGTDAIYLDTKTWLYIPTIPEAQFTAETWNSPDVQDGVRMKIYLENICIEWLKEYTNYGRDDLEKRVPPEVKVTGQISVEVTKLHCWVYGFYPRAIDVRWMKNEKDEVPIDEVKSILPNPDITYQTKVTIEVPAGKEDSYSCHVDHSSLKKTLIVQWNTESLPIGLIIGVFFSCLIVPAIAGVIYKNRECLAGRIRVYHSVRCFDGFQLHPSDSLRHEAPTPTPSTS